MKRIAVRSPQDSLLSVASPGYHGCTTSGSSCFTAPHRTRGHGQDDQPQRDNEPASICSRWRTRSDEEACPVDPTHEGPEV